MQPLLPVSYTHLDVYKRQAHYKALEPVEPDTATVTIKFVDENKETLREDQVVYPTVGEKLYSSEALMKAVNSIEGYIFQNFTWSSPDNMPEEGDSIVTEGSYTLYAHYKALEPVAVSYTHLDVYKRQEQM